jgi:hypothetical protein
MRAAGLTRNKPSAYDCLAVIMTLIAYIIVGGISGFGPDGSGHTQLETVHLPNASRDSGVVAYGRSSYLLSGEDGVSAELPGVLPESAHQAVGTTPPPSIKAIPAAANDFAQFASFLILNLLTDARHAELFETQTVLTASPAWWLRTVVLHL